MQVRFSKKDDRATLTCIRQDGSFTQARVGPGLPAHDLAHFSGESVLGLRFGFFGAISRGRTMQELSDPALIPTFDRDWIIAEAVARGLGGIANGACDPGECAELIRAELGDETCRRTFAPGWERMIPIASQRFSDLLEAWKRLGRDETLTLEFPE